MKLFIVHCGFYDSRIQGGVFEGHTNIYVVARSPQEARERVKARPDFRSLKMHVDGLQEIVSVDGYELELRENKSLGGKTLIKNQKLGSRGAIEVEL